MRVIIAGSRTRFVSPSELDAIVRESRLCVTTVISGGCRGIDASGEEWARLRGNKVERYPADWKLGRRAGPMRNEQMAKNADALIAIWDGRSPGTKGMIACAKRHGLKVFVHEAEVSP